MGVGANRKITAKVLKQLIDDTDIPFITSRMGKGVVDERHPRFLGNAALSSGDFVHCAVDAADLIVNIGHDVIRKPPFFMVRKGTEVIHINFRSAEVDAVYFLQIEVIGDIANALWQIGEALNDTSHWDFTTTKSALPAITRFTKPNTVLLDSALATMGAGLPSAMAAHLVYRMHGGQPNARRNFMSEHRSFSMQFKNSNLFRQQAFIDGAWVDADNGQTIKVNNPATGETLGTVPKMGGAETRHAIEVADRALPT